MDLDRLDSLARALAAAASRRRLLGVLTAVPLLGGLLDILSMEDADAKERRRRRKGRHKRRKRKGQVQRARKGKRRRCKPKGRTKVCAGTCGEVTNRKTCGKPVDCGPCPCTSGLTSTEDLQQAINAASDGATLTLCPGTWVVPATLQITKPLTIVGAGAGQTILDGGKKHRVIDIPADVAVRLEALTITNGVDALEGGGIRNAGRLLLVNAELTANTSGSDLGPGGAISSTNDLTLRNTIVHHNTSKLAGGGILMIAGTMTLEHGSSIEVNTAVVGGGIYADKNAVVALKPGSRLFRNRAIAGGGGGGVFNDGILTLEGGSSIEGNIADVYGGGIAAFGLVTLKLGSRVDKNHADDWGGGIYASRSTKVTLEPGSQMIDNTSDVGGAIYHDPEESSDSEVKIGTDVLICGNSDPQCAGKDIDGPGTCPSDDSVCP